MSLNMKNVYYKMVKEDQEYVSYLFGDIEFSRNWYIFSKVRNPEIADKERRIVHGNKGKYYKISSIERYPPLQSVTQSWISKNAKH